METTGNNKSYIIHNKSQTGEESNNSRTIDNQSVKSGMSIVSINRMMSPQFRFKNSAMRNVNLTAVSSPNERRRLPSKPANLTV